ncbi:MAG: nicotinate (nicotinamide) nucleotide adenylyltransferase [Anaerolineales bacterium]
MRIGIFGGTFNPPHIGHMILADTAAEELGLDRVLFVPAAEPPHKQGWPRAAVEHRLRMVEMAIAGQALFQLSAVDVTRPGPHYAADMIRIVAEHHPGAALFFLMGSDSLRDLLAWHQPEAIVAQCHLVVMSRPVNPPDMAQLYEALPQLRERLIAIESPEIEISSTNIVARIRAGKSVRYRLPDVVLDYILEHQLYKE